MDREFEKAEESAGGGAAVRSNKSDAVNVAHGLDSEFRGGPIRVREGATADAGPSQGGEIIRSVEGNGPGLAAIGCDLDSGFNEVLVGEQASGSGVGAAGSKPPAVAEKGVGQLQIDDVV